MQRGVAIRRTRSPPEGKKDGGRRNASEGDMVRVGNHSSARFGSFVVNFWELRGVSFGERNEIFVGEWFGWILKGQNRFLGAVLVVLVPLSGSVALRICQLLLNIYYDSFRFFIVLQYGSHFLQGCGLRFYQSVNSFDEKVLKNIKRWFGRTEVSNGLNNFFRDAMMRYGVYRSFWWQFGVYIEAFYLLENFVCLKRIWQDDKSLGTSLWRDVRGCAPYGLCRILSKSAWQNWLLCYRRIAMQTFLGFLSGKGILTNFKSAIWSPQL